MHAHTYICVLTGKQCDVTLSQICFWCRRCNRCLCRSWISLNATTKCNFTSLHHLVVHGMYVHCVFSVYVVSVGVVIRCVARNWQCQSWCRWWAFVQRVRRACPHSTRYERRIASAWTPRKRSRSKHPFLSQAGKWEQGNNCGDCQHDLMCSCCKHHKNDSVYHRKLLSPYFSSSVSIHMKMLAPALTGR